MKHKTLRTFSWLAPLLLVVPAGSAQDDGTKGAEEEHSAFSSHFVPSFGPPSPPEENSIPATHARRPDPHTTLSFAGNPVNHIFHTPVSGHNFMHSRGFSYAYTYPHNKPAVPFISSPSDTYLSPQHTFPYQQVRFPYAEEFPHHSSFSSPSVSSSHVGGYLPHPPVFRHGSHHALAAPPPPPPPSYHAIPHNNPHSFHSVVNYGHINLHHGDHYEPHNNGKDSHHSGPAPPPLPPLPPSAAQYSGLPGLSALSELQQLSPPYLPQRHLEVPVFDPRLEFPTPTEGSAEEVTKAPENLEVEKVQPKRRQSLL